MAVRKLFATIEEYEQRFGEGSSYGIPEPSCPKGWPTETSDIIALHERCLAKNRPWESVLDKNKLLPDTPDMLY